MVRGFLRKWFGSRGDKAVRSSLSVECLEDRLVPSALAAVSTDQLDYAPGAWATISGHDFDPNESVTLQVVHQSGLVGGQGHDPWTVTAGPDGSFTSAWYVDPDDSVGETFLLTADGSLGSHASATFTDAKPTVTDIASDPSASETGPDLGTYTFSRGTDTTGNLKIHFSISGNATLGSDYTLSGGSIDADDPSNATVTIANGTSSVTLTLTPIDDAVVEGDETAVLTIISHPSDYNVGEASTATVTIGDDTNHQPTALDDSADANEHGPAVTINVLGNDSDPDATDTLSVQSVDTTGTKGTVTNNGDSVTYDPNGQFQSLADGETATDSFSYTVSDGK